MYLLWAKGGVCVDNRIVEGGSRARACRPHTVLRCATVRYVLQFTVCVLTVCDMSHTTALEQANAIALAECRVSDTVAK